MGQTSGEGRVMQAKAARASGGHDALDLVNQFAQVEGLGEHFGSRGLCASGGKSDASEAGDKDDFHRRIELRATAGELNAVKAWHDDVGEQEIEDLALKRLERRTALIKILYDMPCALQRVEQKAPQAVIVLGKQYLGHSLKDLAPASIILQFVRLQGKAVMNTP